jgi:hypothetical protein
VFVNPVIRNLGVYIHSFVERIVSYCEGFPSSWYLHPFMQVGILSRVLEEVVQGDAVQEDGGSSC